MVDYKKLLLILNCMCWGVSTLTAGEARHADDQTGPLLVVASSPRDSSGPIDSPECIQITFNSPMVVITTPSDQAAPVGITVDPPVKGEWRWIGTDAVEFRPDSTFQINTEYTVSLKKGLRSAVSGKCLQQAYSWKFRTMRFEFKSLIDSSDYGLIQKAPLYVQFNQGLDLKACQSALTIVPSLPFELVYADSAESYYRFGIYRRPSHIGQTYQDQVVKIVPKENWARSATYSILISKSLRPKIGNMGLEKDTVLVKHTAGDLIFKCMEQYFDDWTVADSIVEPENEICFRFSNHIDWKQQRRHITIKPKAVIDSTFFSGPNKRLCLSGGIIAATRYAVTFGSQLTDIFGNRLGKQISIYFITDSNKPFAGILHDNWNMESYGHRLIPVYYCNKDSIELDLISLPIKAAIEWHRRNNTFDAMLARAEHDGWPVCRIRTVPDTTRNRYHLWKLPLDTILHGKPGFVAVRLLKNHDTVSSENQQRAYHNRTYSGYAVSNIGLTIQRGNGEYRFIATRLDNGAPLPGTDIKVSDSAGQTLWSGVTSADGQAVLSDDGDFRARCRTAGQSPPYVVATHDTGWIFKKLFDYSFSETAKRTLPIIAHAFTDRGLYLPGDTVRFMAILRTDDDSLIIPRQCRVRIITSCNYRDQRCDTVAVSDFGTFTYALPIPGNAEFGRYTIYGEVVEEDSLPKMRLIKGNISSSFIVGEFRANSVDCEITSPKDTFIVGDTVAVRVIGRYLYDAPFAHAKGQITLLKKPYLFSSSVFRGYTFDFDAWNMERNQSDYDTNFICTLDSSGKYDFTVPLTDTLYRGGYICQITCDASSAHDNVSASKRIVVHPGAYYIGLKPHAWYGAVGEAQTFDVATVTISGKPVAVENLIVTVLHHQRKTATDGSNSITESLVWNRKISTNASGIASFSFKPRQQGDYTVIVSGKVLRIASSVAFTAINHQWHSDEPEFSLKTDKPEYEVGDTVRILISNVLRKGKALVTTERDHVFTSEWADIAPDHSEIKIPVLPFHRSGFWVSIAACYGGKTVAVAGNKQDELRGPQWVTNDVFVKVNWLTKSLKIDLKPDKPNYAPGDEVILECAIPQIQRSKHEVFIWAEDEGVLSLTGYEPPDILDSMYSDRTHGVSLADTRESLLKPFSPKLEEYISSPYFTKGGALAGGTPKSVIAGNDWADAAKARKRFSMCPLFASSVHLDSNGRKTVRFRLPDNLTQFRIMAIAATDDGRFGNGDTSIIVTKPLFIRPIVPYCLRCRDTIRIGSLVENRTDSVITSRLFVTGKGLTFVQPTTGSVNIFSRNREEFYVTAVVDSIIDTVRMLFRAVSPQDSDEVTATIPVTPFRFPESVTVCGIVDKDKYEKISRPLHHDLNRSLLSVEAATTIVQDLKGSLNYLNDYPYDCAEQMASKILPYLLCGDIFKKEAVSSMTDSLIHDKVTTYLRVLPQYESGVSGGFSYWKGGVENNPYLTAYILFSLYRAIDCGYSVQSAMLENCLHCLVRYLRDSTSKKEYDGYAQQCYVASVLSEYDNYQPLTPQASLLVDSLINDLLPQHSKGSLFAQVNLLRIIRNRNDQAGLRRELTDHIREGIIQEPLYAYFDEHMTPGSQRWHQTPVRTTALILQTFLESGEDLPFTDKIVRWLLLQKSREGHWGNTQNNVYALWALSTYAHGKEPPAGTCTARIYLDRNLILKHTFTKEAKRDGAGWRQPFSAIPFRREHSIQFRKSGKGNLYYTLQMNCLPIQPVMPFDAGFRIEKSYSTLEGDPVSLDSLRYREIVLVKTVVSTPRERQYVVINDPVPAGCEIVNEGFSSVERAVKEGIRSKNKAFYRYWTTWNHFEYHKEGCRVFATRLHRGEHQFIYAIRPIARGTFHLPPAHVEEMYSPEVYGRSGEKIAVVR